MDEKDKQNERKVIRKEIAILSSSNNNKQTNRNAKFSKSKEKHSWKHHKSSWLSWRKIKDGDKVKKMLH